LGVIKDPQERVLLGLPFLRDEVQVDAGIFVQHEKISRMADLKRADMFSRMMELFANVLEEGSSRADKGGGSFAPIPLEGMNLEMTQQPVIRAIILEGPIVNFRYGSSDS
jgi:hypothetical protein